MPLPNEQSAIVPAFGKAFPVRTARTLRTRAPVTPPPRMRGWTVATPAGTMKTVRIGWPGCACPSPYDQKISTPFASRRITLRPTGRESGMSARASVSHDSSNTSPYFTAICGNPFTHQSRLPVCLTSKPRPVIADSFTASFSRDHARKSAIAHDSASAPNAAQAAATSTSPAVRLHISQSFQ